ncbi:hypothetical protein BJ508DRAFT_362297 [Ascobolus immersus RN42]|uniref:Uncharacterized protein n=1 Tax=Ascobolus immersus RN42 TaxID=1160509 RepID=A0A3N4I412_ASCIM|nr:hypothetical protein BJ508DRAFT_362297 [Ascobolus immersus RN42]
MATALDSTTAKLKALNINLSPPTQTRLEHLKNETLASKDPKDKVNRLAVIAAYENGDIDLAGQPLGHVCIFWGGVRKTGWFELPNFGHDDVLQLAMKWKSENSVGRMWFEPFSGSRS